MKVLIYTTPNCVQCDMTKKQFANAGVAIEEINLDDANPDIAAWIKEAYGFTQAPVVVTEAGAWSGFKLDRIKGVIQAIHAEGAVKSA